MPQTTYDVTIRVTVNHGADGSPMKALGEFCEQVELLAHHECPKLVASKSNIKREAAFEILEAKAR